MVERADLTLQTDVLFTDLVKAREQHGDWRLERGRERVGRERRERRRKSRKEKGEVRKESFKRKNEELREEMIEISR